MALPNAPTIVTQDELNAILANLKQGTTPYSFKEDAYGNLIITQGELGRQKETIYSVEKPYKTSDEFRNYKQSLTGQLIDLYVEKEKQSLIARGIPEDQIDEDKLRQKASGTVSRNYITGGVTPLLVLPPFETGTSVYSKVTPPLDIRGVAPPVQYTPSEVGGVTPLQQSLYAFSRQQVVTPTIAQTEREAMEVNRDELFKQVKQRYLDLNLQIPESEIDRYAKDEVAAFMSATMQKMKEDPSLSEREAFAQAMEDIENIKNTEVVDPTRLVPQSIAPQGGPMDPMVQAYQRQIDAGQSFKKLNATQAAYRRRQLQNEENYLTQKYYTDLQGEQVDMVEYSPTRFWKPGQLSATQTAKLPATQQIPVEVWTAIVNNNMLVNPPIISKQFDQNVKDYAASVDTALAPENLLKTAIGKKTFKGLPSEEDLRTLSKVRAKQAIGDYESWIYDPNKVDEVLANPQKFTEAGILHDLGPLGGQAETVTGWAMRSMLVPANLIVGGYLHYVNDPLMSGIAYAFDQDVYNVANERERYRAKSQAFYQDSPVLANIALNKGLTGEAEEISKQIGLEGWQKTTHQAGSFVGDFIEPSFGLGTATIGAYKSVKGLNQARQISLALLDPTQTAKQSKTAWEAVKQGAVHGFYQDSNIITGLRPGTTAKYRAMTSPGDVRMQVTNRFADEVVAEDVINDAIIQSRKQAQLQIEEAKTQEHSTVRMGDDSVPFEQLPLARQQEIIDNVVSGVEREVVQDALATAKLDNTGAAAHYNATGKPRGLPDKGQVIDSLLENKVLKNSADVAEFEKTWDEWMATRQFVQDGLMRVGVDTELVQKLRQYYGIGDLKKQTEAASTLLPHVDEAFARNLVMQIAPDMKNIEKMRAVTKRTFAHEDRIPEIINRASKTKLGETLYSIVKRGQIVQEIVPDIKGVEITFRVQALQEKYLTKPSEVGTYYRLTDEEIGYIGEWLEREQTKPDASYSIIQQRIRDSIGRGFLSVEDLRFLIDENLDAAASTVQRDVISAESIGKLSTREQQRWMEAGGFRSYDNVLTRFVDFIQRKGKPVLALFTSVDGGVIPQASGATLQQRRLIKETAQEASTMDLKLKREINGLMGSEEVRARYVADPEQSVDSVQALGMAIVGPKPVRDIAVLGDVEKQVDVPATRTVMPTQPNEFLERQRAWEVAGQQGGMYSPAPPQTRQYIPVDDATKGLEERFFDQMELNKRYEQQMNELKESAPQERQRIKDRTKERRAILKQEIKTLTEEVNSSIDSAIREERAVMDKAKEDIIGKSESEVASINSAANIELKSIAEKRKRTAQHLSDKFKEAQARIEKEADDLVKQENKEIAETIEQYEKRYKAEQESIKEELDNALEKAESDYDATVAKLDEIYNTAERRLQEKVEPRQILNEMDNAIEEIKQGLTSYADQQALADFQARSRRGYLGWDTRRTSEKISDLRKELSTKKSEIVAKKKDAIKKDFASRKELTDNLWNKQIQDTKATRNITIERIKADKTAAIDQLKDTWQKTINVYKDIKNARRIEIKDIYKQSSEQIDLEKSLDMQRIEQALNAPAPVSKAGYSFEELIENSLSTKGDAVLRLKNTATWAVDRLFFTVGEKADLNSSLLRAGGSNLTYKSDILSPKGKALLELAVNKFAVATYADPKMFWENFNTLVGEASKILGQPSNIRGGSTKSIAMVDIAKAQEIQFEFMAGMYFYAEGDRIVARNAIRAVEQELVDLAPRVSNTYFDDTVKQTTVRSYVGNALNQGNQAKGKWRSDTYLAMVNDEQLKTQVWNNTGGQYLAIDKEYWWRNEVVTLLNDAERYGDMAMRKNGIDVQLTDLADVQVVLDDLFGPRNEKFSKAYLGEKVYDEMNKALTDARLQGLTQKINRYLRSEAKSPTWKYTSKAVDVLINLFVGGYRYSALLGSRIYFHTGNTLTGPSMAYATVGNFGTGISRAVAPVVEFSSRAYDLMLGNLKQGKLPQWDEVKVMTGQTLGQLTQPRGNSIKTIFADNAGSKYYNEIAIIDPAGRPYTHGEIYALIQSSGIRSEVNFVTSSLDNGQLVNFLKARGVNASVARKYSQKIGEIFVQDLTIKEDMVFRLNVFYDAVAKGFAVDEAVQLAKRSMYDYSDMSAVEKTVATQYLMFYTFSRQNASMFMRSFTDLEVFKRYVNTLKAQRGVESILRSMDDESGNREVYEKIFMNPMALEKITVRMSQGETRDFYMMSPPIPTLGAMLLTFSVAEDIVSLGRGEEPTGVTRSIAGFVTPGLKMVLQYPDMFEYRGANMPPEYVMAANAFCAGDPTCTAGILQSIVGGELLPLPGMADEGAVNGFVYPLNEAQRERLVAEKKLFAITGFDAPIMEWSKVVYGGETGKTGQQTTAERVLGLTRPMQARTGTKLERSLLDAKQKAMEAEIKSVQSQLRKVEETKARQEEE